MSTRTLYYNHIVSIELKGKELFMITKFDDYDDASRYFNTAGIEDSTLLKRLAMFSCRHEMEYLHVGMERYHYDYCPKCNKGVFVDDKTKEDKALSEMGSALVDYRHNVSELRMEKKDLEYKLFEKERFLVEFEETYRKRVNELTRGV